MINEIELIEEVSNVLNISIYDKQDCSFNEIGIDSIAYVKMLVALEDILEIEFDDFFLDSQNFESIGDFIKAVSLLE